MLFEYFPTRPYAPLVATLLWCLGIGLVAHFTVFRLRFFDDLAKFPMSPLLIGLPAGMFTFMMVFMGSAAWQNIAQAHVSLIAERAAIVRMAAVPILPEEAKRRSQTDLRQYLTAAIDGEWTATYNQQPSPKAEAALDRLEADMWAANALCRSQTAANAPCSSALATSTYIKALDDLRAARDHRLSLGTQGTLPLKWLFAIALALMSGLAIACVHRTSQRTAALAQVLFCTSAWIILSMVALHIQPYRGPDAVSPAPLQALRAVL